MSYGFQLYNANGILLANDTDFNYGLITSGQATAPAVGELIISFPVNTGEIPMVFVKVSGFNWLELSNITTTSASFRSYQEIPTNSYNRRATSPATFQYKIFAPFKFLGNVSGENYGIQVFNGTTKTFDSNYEIPLISGSTSITLPTPSDSNASPVISQNLPAGVSTDPWVNITPIGGDGTVYGIHYPTGGATFNVPLFRCIRVISGVLQVSYGYPYILSTFSTSTFVSGQGSSKVFYFMNTTNLPLTGSISAIDSSTYPGTCNYDAALGSSCYSSKQYVANFFNGNGTQVFYNWSFSSNPGNLSFAGSIVSDVVRIEKTGSGTTTYNATLQCVISQTGQSITVSSPVSLTHTAEANPLAGSISVTNQVSSCTYSSGSCTTSETHTVVNESGGNGTAKTYTWTFADNPGGFTFTTATNTNTVGISVTAAAGTHTCRTQCVISQNGMTPLTLTRDVSHTHTQQAGYTVQNPIPFYGTNLFISSSDGFAGWYVTIRRNGTFFIQSSSSAGSFTEQDTAWVAPQTSTIGDSYWIKWTRSSAVGTSTANKDWEIINGDKTFSVSRSNFNPMPASSTATYNVLISASSAGTILSNSTITLTAEAYTEGGNELV